MPYSKQYQAKKRIGAGLRHFLFQRFPARKYLHLFDCEAIFLRNFIEHQFKTGMRWDNFATKWQIDHIVPLCLFDQTNEEDLKICWNWVNLRPLSIGKNKGKNSQVDMLKILKHRYKYFKWSTAGALIERATGMEKESELTDWSTFLSLEF